MSDSAEMGKNADAAFPGDGAGAGDSSPMGRFKAGAAVPDVGAGEDCGERLPAREKNSDGN